HDEDVRDDARRIHEKAALETSEWPTWAAHEVAEDEAERLPAERVHAREVLEHVVAVEFEQRRQVEHHGEQIREGEPDREVLGLAVQHERGEARETGEREVE